MSSTAIILGPRNQGVEGELVPLIITPRSGVSQVQPGSVATKTQNGKQTRGSDPSRTKVEQAT